MSSDSVSGMVRIGTVSSINKADGTARVSFGDRGSMVSGNIKILKRPPIVKHDGVEVDVEPWMPEIGQTVVCVYYTGDGFIVGGL